MSSRGSSSVLSPMPFTDAPHAPTPRFHTLGPHGQPEAADQVLNMKAASLTPGGCEACVHGSQFHHGCAAPSQRS